MHQNSPIQPLLPHHESSSPKEGSEHKIPPSVNFHLTKYCNMRCKFCYATFEDLGRVKHDLERSRKIITLLAEAGFEKLTFAGGEPTLVKELPELAKLAKGLGLVTTIVTNGANLMGRDYYNELVPHLDWVALSIDSLSHESNLASGRHLARKKVLHREECEGLAKQLKDDGVKLKINTVVSAFNHQEDLTEFINTCLPTRWKLLQALFVEGQNSKFQGEFEVSGDEFKAFIDRHEGIDSRVKIVPEEVDLIKGSYIMLNPLGEFYDNNGAAYRYSKSILEVGVRTALEEIDFDWQKFFDRGGKYTWK